MDDIAKSLNQLKPLAEAIVYLASQGDTLKNLDVKINELEGRIEQRRGEWDESEASATRAKEAVKQASSEVAEAKIKVERMLEDASTAAKQIVQSARNEATNAAKQVSQGFAQDHAKLSAHIVEAKRTLVVLNEQIIQKRRDHDAVMDSIVSLKSRLGAT